MSSPPLPDLDTLSADGLKRLVARRRARVAALEEEDRRLREEDARLKDLPQRPKLAPGGMDRATGPAEARRRRRSESPAVPSVRLTRLRVCRGRPEVRRTGPEGARYGHEMTTHGPDRPRPAKGLGHTPRPSRVRLDTATRVRRELTRIYVEGRQGQRNPADVARLAGVLQVIAKIITDGEFERRLEAVERAAAAETKR
jgi:hypothetical protein